MAKVFLRAYNREIETMIDRGQLDEAIAHCHHILKAFPKHLETYRLLGKAYLESKRYGDAVDIFSRILAAVPNDFVAQVGMSIIRDEENKLDDAIWHMERAFETQPSNSAIQSELQRLYGRRDGVQPPRIRMTRGALAHMYVQGELYPQAISEIKSVLSEDPGRSDMQALLARAHFKSGAKNDAVDAALALLQRNPYALDANRVLADVLSADRNENAQSYRQRVVELDPYAAQVSGSIFLSNEVSDAAVTVDRLDWNGQPVGMQSDWREQQAIGLEGGATGTDEPDWMKGSFAESTPPLAQPGTGSMFETPAASFGTPAQPADEIPDFMKAAGWGQSTGAFDESQPLFTSDEPVSSAEPIAQADLPDWVKAMKPPEPEAAASEQEEELPDWINKIGTGALSASSTEQPDWMSPAEETPSSFAAPSTEEPDWLKGFGEGHQAAQASEDQPDWLKGFGAESEASSQPAQTESSDWIQGLGSETEPAATSDDLDWLKGIGSETDTVPQAAQTDDTPDWLKGIGGEPESTPAAASDDLAWLNNIGKESEPAPAAQADDSDWLQGLGTEAEIMPQPAQTETPDWLKSAEGEPELTPARQADDLDWLSQLGKEAPAATTPSNDFHFLNELTQEPARQAPMETTPAAHVDELGKTEEERDDSFAWLENLAAKQGATEGLLTTPEERLQEEPDWIKQAKGLSTEPAVTQPAASVEELGKSEQERDDSFAWLESLAAKQGASEGLLTKPEERLAEEPEWIKQAKGLTAGPSVSQPAANVEELGKSEQERDDSFAWLESLAAKQGASEGLLTKPEERLQEEPEWVKQAKAVTGEASISQPVVPIEEPVASQESTDDSLAWLQDLGAEQGATTEVAPEPEISLQVEPEPITSSLSETTEAVAQSSAEVDELGKSEQEQDDSFAWLEGLAAKQGASEGLLTKPEERLDEEPAWVKQAKAEQTEGPVMQTPASAGDLGKSEQEQDDSFAWLESLAAKQGASEGLLTKPEERLEQEPEWVRQVKDLDIQPVTAEPEPVPEQRPQMEDTSTWLRSLDEEEKQPEPAATDETPAWLEDIEEEKDVPQVRAADETALWLKSLDESEAASAQEPSAESVEEDMPAWMQNIEQEQASETERFILEPETVQTSPVQPAEESALPSWLNELEEEERASLPADADDLPAWLRGDDASVTGMPEPTRTTDWKPVEQKQPDIIYSPPLEEPKQPEIIYSPPLEDAPRPEPETPLPQVSFEAAAEPRAEVPTQQPGTPEPEQPAVVSAPDRPAPEPGVRSTGMLVSAGTDQTLGTARSELSRSNVPGALDLYSRLIKKGRLLEETIHDLREALDRHPVNVSIWQSLGDAYMRANRLQDALDAYTKAEELLR